MGMKHVTLIRYAAFWSFSIAFVKIYENAGTIQT